MGTEDQADEQDVLCVIDDTPSPNNAPSSNNAQGSNGQSSHSNGPSTNNTPSSNNAQSSSTGPSSTTPMLNNASNHKKEVLDCYVRVENIQVIATSWLELINEHRYTNRIRGAVAEFLVERCLYLSKLDVTLLATHIADVAHQLHVIRN